MHGCHQGVRKHRDQAQKGFWSCRLTKTHPQYSSDWRASSKCLNHWSRRRVRAPSLPWKKRPSLRMHCDPGINRKSKKRSAASMECLNDRIFCENISELRKNPAGGAIPSNRITLTGTSKLFSRCQFTENPEISREHQIISSIFGSFSCWMIFSLLRPNTLSGCIAVSIREFDCFRGFKLL